MQSSGIVFIHDLLVIPLAWITAFWLRFNLEDIPDNFFQTALELLPVLVFVQGVFYIIFGLYRGVWRFASMPDLVRIGKAVFLGVSVSFIFIFLITHMQYIPRSVIPLYTILLFSVLAGNRMLYRWMKDYQIKKHFGKRTLIIGAGEAAELLIRDMLHQRFRQFLPVGIVDDNHRKLGRELHGIRVIGRIEDITTLVNNLDINLILIAIPSLSSDKMRRVVEICERTGIQFRTLPKFEDLISGQVVTTALRNVSIEDLLGREKIELDWNLIRDGLSGRTILVSGGGGSIGSELCHQIVTLKPSVLIILEQSEFNLYRIKKDLDINYPEIYVVPILGDICDRQTVDKIVSNYRPALVFHAAAYKQVPLLQMYPREAAKNNILGTVNLAKAADKYDCEKFIFISTDKAVNPMNNLGASKRLAELFCEYMEQTSKTRFISVRFGNVLGSDGSVVPLFKEQIEKGGPVTVTHPEITRYFMTIREACQLILQVAVIDEKGDVFVLDMGEPVKIVYLAEQMIRLSGKIPEEEIEIQYIGLRPGEKLHEELFYENEINEKTDNDKILLARHNPVNVEILNETIDRIKRACDEYDDKRIERILNEKISPLKEN